jgi:hypothetical protein
MVKVGIVAVDGTKIAGGGDASRDASSLVIAAG